jgi:CubicO group peptidase (beta-lactamase class C family)
MRTIIRHLLSRRLKPLQVAIFMIGVALLISGAPAAALTGISAALEPGATAGASALKPINQAALQGMVDKTATELMVPGAVVLLRTPQGEFTITSGTTRLGAKAPPRANTHFRIASNTPRR